MGYPKSLILTMQSGDDPELSDGAWQQKIEDSVEIYNQLNGTSYNTFDAFLYYFENKCKQ